MIVGRGWRVLRFCGGVVVEGEFVVPCSAVGFGQGIGYVVEV